MKSLFQEQLIKEILPNLAKVLKVKNPLATPRPKVGYIQIGIGKLITTNPEGKEKIIEDAVFVLNRITGQKPKIVMSKKAIAGFKLRERQPVAVLTTLRKNQLLNFIDRFLTYALPRTKDFKGVESNNVDKKGNLNLGLRECGVFPEVISDKIKINFGLQITLISNGASREANIKLWEALGFPMRL